MKRGRILDMRRSGHRLAIATRRRTESDRDRDFSANPDFAGGLCGRLWIFFYRRGEPYFRFAECCGIFHSGHSSPAQSTLPIAGPITTNTSVAALAVGDLSSLAASSIHDQCRSVLENPGHHQQCDQLLQLRSCGHCLYAGGRSGGANFLPESRGCYLHGAAADSDELFFSFTGALDEVSSAGFNAGDGLDEANLSIPPWLETASVERPQRDVRQAARNFLRAICVDRIGALESAAYGRKKARWWWRRRCLC